MLGEMIEDERISEVCFKIEDLPQHAKVLRIPEKVICADGTIASQIEGLCIFLK